MIEHAQQIIQENENLKAELTKARELLHRSEPWLRKLNAESQNGLSAFTAVREYLSNQSAPADKGQGEPVALTNAQRRAADHKEQKAFNDWAFHKEGEAVGRMDGASAALVAWHARAKLAEQPAPVTVVMPEPQQPRGDGGASYYIPVGWNACLDEVARLNHEPKP